MTSSYTPIAPEHVVKSENFSDPKVIANYLIQTVPHLFEVIEDKRKTFDQLWAEYSIGHGMPWDPIRIVQFMYLLDIANALPEGDYGEFGSHKGLMAKVIYKLMDPKATMYSFDTFEGFKKQDLKVESKIYTHNWTEGNFLPTSPEDVTNYVGDGNAPTNFKTVQGWFPESFSGYEDKKWRFVHIDFDLYQPPSRCTSSRRAS